MTRSLSMSDICPLQQGFGESPATYTPLKGHPGRDTACGYGSVVLSPVKGVVYSMYTPDKPANDGYTAVYILCRTKLETFEFSIGHLSKIYVKVGDTVEVGTPLGEEGNKGYVFAGNKRITLDMQRAGNKEGSHRHNQKRVVMEVITPGKLTCLRTAKGYYRSPETNNYYARALSNGFASCTDYSKPLFNRPLKQGDKGYDVKLLQRALGIAMPTAYFGIETETALREFQKKHINIVGAVTGALGPKTRAVLNATYGPLVDPEELAPVYAMIDDTKDIAESLPSPQKERAAGLVDGFIKKVLQFLGL